jgi:hypothetical protein
MFAEWATETKTFSLVIESTPEPNAYERLLSFDQDKGCILVMQLTWLRYYPMASVGILRLTLSSAWFRRYQRTEICETSPTRH